MDSRERNGLISGAAARHRARAASRGGACRTAGSRAFPRLCQPLFVISNSSVRAILHLDQLAAREFATIACGAVQFVWECFIDESPCRAAFLKDAEQAGGT
jgi:hypothetical protein